jgi:uracil-DNA glycosylase
MPKIKLVLLLGSYAHDSYLKKNQKKSLTETLPHPSPLNNIWLHKNSWFKENMLSSIQKIIKSALK